jgi:septum formation protein
MDISESLQPVVLASASPRRRDILTRLGIPFETRVSGVDEPEISRLSRGDGDPPGPADLARECAVLKARSVGRELAAGTVIGSDTVVAVGALPLGKPESADDARRILSLLSGKVQDVISGICLIHVPTGIELSGYDVTRVFTKQMSDRDIDEYIATGECFGKAGAYAIQESGDRFVDRIDGSFDNVVGFPTELFLKLIAQLAREVQAEKDR